jgi:hypothetical protein
MPTAGMHACASLVSIGNVHFTKVLGSNTLGMYRQCDAIYRLQCHVDVNRSHVTQSGTSCHCTACSRCSHMVLRLQEQAYVRNNYIPLKKNGRGVNQINQYNNIMTVSCSLSFNSFRLLYSVQCH